jgi:tagatose 1,6-diphosphate aldolase GatY/KbaY
MLAQTANLLKDAQANGYAVGGFNVYNLEGVQAVITAAQANRSPALLQVHPGALAHGGTLLLALCLKAAEEATAPIAVHLDHCADADDIDRALATGLPSVMADGSHLPDDANIAFVRAAVERAHDVGAAVEGELGRISGTEDGLSIETIHARMTDPAQAADFVNQTELDMLAVCIGNIHGPYPFPPQLDFDRLAAIRDAVGVPLVLHGASGLPAAQITQAIARGVCKFNVNTEVRRAYLRALHTADPDLDLVPLMQAAQNGMAAVITEKMVLFGSVNQAVVLASEANE